MSDQHTEPPREPDGGDDEHRDLVLRDDSARKPGWMSTYGSSLFRIAILLVLLLGLVVLRKPCADGMAGFIGNFGQPSGPAGPRDAAPQH